MITENDLQEAIAECRGQRNPNASTCIKLAAFYVIMDHLKGEQAQEAYSYSPAPFPQSTEPTAKISYYGESEFLEAIAGKDSEKIWLIMDDLMSALSVLNPKLYDSVLQKIDDA